ncbi:unnamed protein product [Rotaria sordida]|uniref:Uncharacterized protein n=1 Tax=Rotaria sordida TaxID=392033 RepID=A0A816C6J9_9BILA|nr:unnamed protein product [Rotaria sordida]CAF1620709.1 unnamed protein product [Rotaria sordida]
MSLSNEDLQQYIGQNVDSVKQELENQGCKVHLVRTGRFATGCIMKPPRVPGQEQEKHVSVSFNGDDSERKVTFIRLLDD